jgi:hypothetical protein
MPTYPRQFRLAEWPAGHYNVVDSPGGPVWSERNGLREPKPTGRIEAELEAAAGNDKSGWIEVDFDAELDEGNRLAKALAEHVERMSAGKAQFTFDVYGSTYTVLVAVNEPPGTSSVPDRIIAADRLSEASSAVLNKLVQLNEFRDHTYIKGPDFNAEADALNSAWIAYRAEVPSV